MKQRQLKVEKLREILTITTHKYDPNNPEYIFNLEDRLLTFGMEKANKACEMYLWTAKDNFFDSFYLMQCLLEVSNELPDSNEAWVEVVKQIRGVGMNGKPEFDNPIIIKTINSLGGWRFLCESTSQGYDRNTFVKIYEEIKNKEMLKSVLN